MLKALGCKANGGALHIGFTATAYREDGKGFAEVFDKITFEIGITELVDSGYLVRPHGRECYLT